jgi:carbon-monoxide dehydrogenase medium subunit
MLTGFDYVAARSVEEYFSLIRQYGGEARVLAGGTDLLVAMKEKELKARYLIDIKEIPGFTGISYSASEGLKIGASLTIHSIETSQAVSDSFPTLCEAASQLGSYQVRHRATLGGNLCNASPAADMATPLMALDAKLNVVSEAGERTIPIEQFFVGPGKTTLGTGEILKGISVSTIPSQTGCNYIKLGRRRAMDCAIVNVAVSLTLESSNGSCRTARIALGSVAPTPLRAVDAENMLKNQKISSDLILKAALTAQHEAKPISDVRASADYRFKMTRVVVARALTNAYHMAQERIMGERTR